MPVIVISGPPGAGSTTVGRLLAERLKLDFFGAGDYFKGHSEGDSETEKVLRFWRTKKGSSKEFHVDLDNMLKDIAKKGDIVIQSKLAIKLLKGKYDFSIWLDAPLNIRGHRTHKRDRIPVDRAEKDVSVREDKERKSWKEIYGFDYFSQQNEADIAIDSSDKTPDEIVNLIIDEMRRKKVI